MELKGSKTEDNLKAAFAGESQANRRYLYFAQKADVEGHNDVATVFRSTAEVKRMNIRSCTPVCQKLHVMRVLMKLQIGLKL